MVWVKLISQRCLLGFTGNTNSGHHKKINLNEPLKEDRQMTAH